MTQELDDSQKQILEERRRFNQVLKQGEVANTNALKEQAVQHESDKAAAAEEFKVCGALMQSMEEKVAMVEVDKAALSQNCGSRQKLPSLQEQRSSLKCG